MVLCKHYFAYLIQVKNLTLKSFQLFLLVVFFIEVTFLSQISPFSRNLNCHWKCREQKENFQTILMIIFWNFTIFYYRSDSPQVKGNLISSMAKLVYKLPQELQNDLRLRISGSQEILEKYAQCIVSLPELRLCKQQLKTRKNRCQTFLFLSSFTGLLHFVLNILFGFVEYKESALFIIYHSCKLKTLSK